MESSQTSNGLTPAPGIDRVARGTGLAERVSFCLFVGGLAWVPLWYGSNVFAAWGMNAILFPGLAAFYEISLLSRGKPHPVGVRTLAVPALMFAAVVLWLVFQAATWAPAALVNPIWRMAADTLGTPLAGSISVNRDLTILGLVRLITAASVFWLALQLCRNDALAIRLVGSVGAICTVYAAYGIIALDKGGRATATFVNHNSFATYAGMGLVAIGGLVLHFYRDEVRTEGSWRLRLSSFIEMTGQKGAIAVAGGFVVLVALLLTGSRGGVISTGVGLLVLGVLTSWRSRKKSRSSAGALVFGLALTAATLVGFGGTFTANLEERGFSDTNRIAVYLLTLRSIFDMPVLGFGYGTFRDVFPMYRDRSISVLGVWGQAHDSYLEVLQGLGLAFGSMLIVAVLLLLLHCVRGSVRRKRNAIVPQIAASVTCLVGVHALADFSLQMQAVALTFAALLGAGVAQANSSRLPLED